MAATFELMGIRVKQFGDDVKVSALGQRPNFELPAALNLAKQFPSQSGEQPFGSSTRMP